MSFEDDFADLLVEDHSDCDDQEYNLRPNKKKKSTTHSFMFKDDEEKTIMNEIKQNEQPAKKRRKGKNKNKTTWNEICGPNDNEELKVIPCAIKGKKMDLIITVKYSDPDEEKAANSFIDEYTTIKKEQDFLNQKVMEDIEKESDLGNTEYKLMLKFPNADRLNRLTTQMKFRMQEGNGEAFYYIGVKDDGEAQGITTEQMELSLRTLHRMAWTLKYSLAIRSINKGKKGEIAKVMVF